MNDSTIKERVDAITNRINAACERCGRDPAEVEVVAVSKTHPPEIIREAADCGLTVFGESRVQEARAKIPECPGHLTWHLVGHLQSNKVRPAVELFDVVHSIDSKKLLGLVDETAKSAGKVINVYLQINVAGESTKYGLSPEDAPAVLEDASSRYNVNLCGLMTIPPLSDNLEKTSQYFKGLRELRDTWQESLGFSIDRLSMGMTHDFELAIEEGATTVRIGTAIFGKRKKQDDPVE